MEGTLQEEARVSPYCARCLTRRNSYSSEAHFCFSCRSLYNKVFDEVAGEHSSLRSKAEGYQHYVGDCRPWRSAAEMLLPLLVLNRLALDERAFVRGDGSPSYDAAFAARADGLLGASGAPLWAGSFDLLLDLSWPLTPRALDRGLERLQEHGMIEPAGHSPYDPRIELWFVNAPYRRPRLSTELDEETGLVVRGVAAGSWGENLGDEPRPRRRLGEREKASLSGFRPRREAQKLGV